MMKKILLSLGTLLFVGAVVATSTGAFFSDTETSTGNTFTAGAIDLKVDSEQHYNGNICVPATTTAGFVWNGPSDYPQVGTPCTGTWELTDLGPQHQFFNFADVKPGDEGENTVSLHIENNPAWACVDLVTTSNNENILIEPEASAGDVTNDPNGGELAGNINFQSWLDEGDTPGFGNDEGNGEGDNIWQEGEPALTSGTLASLLNATTTLTLADGGFGEAIEPSVTNYIGLFWCAGTITGGAGNLGCDGSSMGNLSQTDSVTANVIFRVEQERNNPGFRCVPEVVVAPTTGSLTVTKVVVVGSDATPAVVTDFPLNINGMSVLSGVASTTSAGAHIVGELNTDSDYVGVFSGDCDVAGNVIVPAGGSASCTITNTFDGTQTAP